MKITCSISSASLTSPIPMGNPSVPLCSPITSRSILESDLRWRSACHREGYCLSQTVRCHVHQKWCPARMWLLAIVTSVPSCLAPWYAIASPFFHAVSLSLAGGVLVVAGPGAVVVHVCCELELVGCLGHLEVAPRRSCADRRHSRRTAP